MTQKPFGRHRSKISPLQTPSEETLAYAEKLKALNLHELGPGELALGEWAALGLDLPDLPEMRRYRLARVREQLRRLDYAGIVLYDPLNVRYATDSTNMQIWTMHNAVRYCFIATEGPVVLFDFHGSAHLSAHLELVDEVRIGTSSYYFGAGDRYVEQAGKWAAEIADLVHAHGGGNRRLAIDQCSQEGLEALHGGGIETFNGQEVMELARSIKSPDEIRAMRCSIAACETAMDVMRAALVPGVTENRLWSVLHAENIARGGEWIETRLLSSGPRTNPWFQECSSRKIEAGDLVGFDTDLIGPYGMCCDISRTWICGAKPDVEQRRLYRIAYDQILKNTALLQPGVTFEELTFESEALAPEFAANHYSCLYHGVGLCDEYPSIGYPELWEDFGYEGVLEPGMVLCVESYVGEEGGREGVKLEEQVLVTEDGHEVLSNYPFENELLR